MGADAVLYDLERTFGLLRAAWGRYLPPSIQGLITLGNATVEKMQHMETPRTKHNAKWNDLRGRMLQLLVSIVMTMAKHKGEEELPDDLEYILTRLLSRLNAIMEIASNATQRRSRIEYLLSRNSRSKALKSCQEDFVWAVRAYEIASSLVAIGRKSLPPRSGDETRRLLESLPRARYANFYGERPDRPARCFETTGRVACREVYNWATRAKETPQQECCFWLRGTKGTGTTTIARTVAEQLQGSSLLGGSFFFSGSGDPELRTPALVFPTLAYQVAQVEPKFADSLGDTIQGWPELPFADLKLQLDRLIISPFHSARRPLVLVLDGIDECGARASQDILRLLLDALPNLSWRPVKIIITSRPEPYIQSILVPSEFLRIFTLDDMEPSMVRHDIKLYLNHRIRNLPRELGHDLPDNWIDDHELEIIRERAGVNIGKAANYYRYLAEGQDLPKQLKTLLARLNSDLLQDRNQYDVDPANLRYDLTKRPIRGGFGEVRRATLEDPKRLIFGDEVAVKELKFTQDVEVEIMMKRFVKEALVWSTLHHPQILPLIGFHFDRDRLQGLLICPWQEEGNVMEYLIPRRHDLRLLFQLIIDTSEALAYLHSGQPPVCHGDLKGANVLVTIDGRAKALLCDFGLAKAIDESSLGLTTTEGFKGSTPWCSPELHENQERSTHSDIWAWGLLVWEMVTGRTPFDDVQMQSAIILRIMRNQMPKLDEPIFVRFPALSTLLRRCWTPEPTARPTIQECLEAVKSLEL